MSQELLDLGMKFQSISVVIRIMITLGLYFLLYVVNKGISHSIDNTDWSSKRIIKSKRMFLNINRLLYIFALVPIWIYETRDILTFLGIFSAGLAFALRDVVANFLGWIIINTKSPFQIGDRIKIAGSLGDVLEIKWFYTTIIEVTEDQKKYGQSTGRFVYIPNIKIITEQVVNETKSFPFIWNELSIPLTMESNWETAKKIIMDIAAEQVGHIEKEAEDSLREASKAHPIYYQTLAPTVYTSIETGKIILTLRFICKSRNFRNLEHMIIEGVLKDFSKHEDIRLSQE